MMELTFKGVTFRIGEKGRIYFCEID